MSEEILASVDTTSQEMPRPPHHWQTEKDKTESQQTARDWIKIVMQRKQFDHVTNMPKQHVQDKVTQSCISTFHFWQIGSLCGSNIKQ